MPSFHLSSSPTAVPVAVLILCADDTVEEALIRELAGRRYQPLVGHPGLSWRAALEWAHPVAAVVDTQHPAARSDGFLAASQHLRVGLVVFGDPQSPAASYATGPAIVAATDARRIGAAVDDTVRSRAG
jgi:hypothetical protein